MSLKTPIKVISTTNKDTLTITFWPTDICNFNCSYCFPGSGNIGKFRYPTNIDLVIKNFRLLFDLYSRKLGKNKFYLTIVGGGEPTLWPHLNKFCKEIKEDHDVYITIITNGSRSLNWWNRNLTYFDNISLCCHNEFIDIDHYISVGDLLYEKNVKIVGLMLMDAKNWDRCVDYIEKMKHSRYPWFIEAKTVFEAPGHGIDVYTKEQLEYLDNSLKRLPNGNYLLDKLSEMKPFESVVQFDDGSVIVARPHDIILNKWNNFKDWKCDVLLNSVLIRYDGSVTGSCQAPIFVGKKLNLFSENFKEEFDDNIDFKPIICPKQGCFCQPDTHISKTKMD